eukprot:TRINITY_DN27109_c0_g1_i1.p1 TRINITY_DN27109_c0_g1~~TRINITY_DN27109_c0_g1_i1.p1  ORF type:complete len:551 (+),score=124.43 TRINITY_DN27109_c0_g1_i1:59-1711(+)
MEEEELTLEPHVYSACKKSQKTWTVPPQPEPRCITVLMEWFQHFSPQTALHWRFPIVLGPKPVVVPKDCDISVPGEFRGNCDISNTKGRLNELFSAVLRRPLTRSDIHYKTGQQDDGSFVSVIALSIAGFEGCAQGSAALECTGSAASTKKEAEKSAASKALAELALLPLPQPQQKPSHVACNDVPPSQPPVPALHMNPKTQLNELIINCVGQPLQPGQVLYSSCKTESGFVATVKIAVAAEAKHWPADLPVEFAGEDASTKKAAEQSAAAKALAGLGGPLRGLRFAPKDGASNAIKAPVMKSAACVGGAAAADRSVTKIVAPLAPVGTKATPHVRTGGEEEQTMQVKEPTHLNAKSQLNEIFIRALGRPLWSSDVTYDANRKSHPSGEVSRWLWTSTVQYTGPGERWPDGLPTSFTGDSADSKKEAEQKAAAAAVAALGNSLPAHQLKEMKPPAPVQPAGVVAPGLAEAAPAGSVQPRPVNGFGCELEVQVGERIVLTVLGETGEVFRSKKAAKESIAWRACRMLTEGCAMALAPASVDCVPATSLSTS